MGTWRIVGTSWKTSLRGLGIAGLIAAFHLIVGLVSLAFINETGQVEVGGVLGGVVLLLLVLIQFFVVPAIQGGCLSFANMAVSQSPASSPFAGFKEGAGRFYGRLLGFEALTVAMAIGLAIVALLLFGIAVVPAERVPALGLVLALFASVVVGIGFYLFLLVASLAPAAVVVENVGVFSGVKRGLQIGRVAVGKLLLVSLALGLTLLPVGILIAVPTFFQQAATSAAMGWRIVAVFLRSVVTGLATVLFTVAAVQIYRHRAGVAANPSSSAS